MIGQLLWNGVLTGSIYALTALGFALIYRTVRFFHFAHGAVYTVGAYCAYLTAVRWRWGLAAGFFLPARPAPSPARLLTGSAINPSDVGTRRR